MTILEQPHGQRSISAAPRQTEQVSLKTGLFCVIFDLLSGKNWSFFDKLFLDKLT